MKSAIYLFFLFPFSTQLTGQTLVQSYVDTYQSIAIEEMQRTGIPASIKLAQALLESNAGRSPLSNRANNHFGIKCGNEWTGREIYQEDDDYGIDSVLTKSCFRVFESARESFVAHSDFLLNPKKAYRYASLFSLSSNDYVAWAWGLQNAGYATDPSYAQKLINYIETHHLYTYDDPDGAPLIAQKTEAIHPGISFSHIVQTGESLQSIATQYGIDPGILIASNSMTGEVTTGQELIWRPENLKNGVTFKQAQ